MKTTVRIVKKDLLYTMRDGRTVLLAFLMPCVLLASYAFYTNGMLSSEDEEDLAILLAKLVILMLFTLVLFLSVLTGTLELGVAEKEHGTLIATLQTGVSRRRILLCKVVALLFEGILTLGVLNASIVVLSLIPNNLFFVSELFSWSDVLQIDIFMVGCLLLFSILELSVSMSVRSYKEGQILSVPMMALVLGSFAYVLSRVLRGEGIGMLIRFIPVINISAGSVGIVMGELSPTFVAILLVPNIVVAVLSVILITKKLDER